MTTAKISKIQVLADRETGHPIFYCHSADRDHAPALSVEKVNEQVLLRARQTLFKIKFNPQTKNRIDIYMSLEEARALGQALVEVAQSSRPSIWRESHANPGRAAKGNMRLPNIVWAKYERFLRVGARFQTGTQLLASGGYINVDLEYPDDSHIKMKNHEIHIGIQLDPPTGTHDSAKAQLVHVPEEELQRGRNEKNPLQKTLGDVYVELAPDVAAGLGELLETVFKPD